MTPGVCVQFDARLKLLKAAEGGFAAGGVRDAARRACVGYGRLRNGAALRREIRSSRGLASLHQWRPPRITSTYLAIFSTTLTIEFEEGGRQLLIISS